MKNESKTPKKTKATPEDVQDTHAAPSLIAPNSKVTVTIDTQIAKKAYDKTLNKLAKNVKMHGFRLGKVPAHLAEEQLGRQYIIERALNEVLPEAYESTIKSSGKKPITYPEFQAISVDADTPWEIEAQFAEAPEFSIKDYKKTAKTAKESAVKEWKEKEKSKKEAKDAPTEDKTQSTEEQQKEFTVQKIYAALITEFKPQIPELLVKQEVQYEINQLMQQLQMFNMKMEDFLARRQMTLENLTQEMTAAALGRLQLMFILQKINEEAKLDATDADVEAWIENNGGKEFVQQQQGNPEYKARLKDTLSRQNIVEHLLSVN